MTPSNLPRQETGNALYFLSPATLALACLTVAAFLLFAGQTAFTQTIPEKDQPFLDTAQEQTSALVLDFADWLDDFFDDDRFTDEENRTRIKLALSSGYSENDSFEIKPKISGRIDLPHVSEKLNLLLLASDDRDFNPEQNPLSAAPRHQESGNREIAAALQYFHREKERYNFSSTVGVSFQYLFAGVRYRSSQDFGTWYGRFINRLIYYTDDGLEDIISYSLERRLSEYWFFRTTATADWFMDRDGLQHSLIFGFYQVLNQEKAVLYEVGNFFDTEDSYQMTDLQLRLRYRQRFLRDWLILEVTPQVTFPEDHDREANPGLIVRFEAFFGNLSGLDIFSGIFDF
jgi:hypothetical protein